MAYCYYPARACYLLFLIYQPVYYLLLMAPHTIALSFSYDFSNPGDLDRANLTYLGNSTAGDGIINLTNMNDTWSTGGVAYPQPVRLWDHRTGRRASFTTNFSFAISGERTYNRADGMAFFIGSFRSAVPLDSGGGFLGLISNITPPPLSTVGVEFDTNRNAWDPQDAIDHFGIDVNNITSIVVYKSLGQDFPNPLSGTMSAGVNYDGSSKVLSVSLRLANGDVHDLETSVDLKAAGVPQYATIGFSAATGNHVESHQLLSWSFNSRDPPKFELWVIILLAVASVSFAALVAALLWIIMHRHYSRASSMKIELQVAREFSYQELSAATSNFFKDRKLGAGQFGEVYRGELPDPLMPPVAVKRLTRQMEARTRKDYVTEIMTLGRLSHRNLVKLVGWCQGGNELLLVYELVTNRSLDEHLHRSERLLAWPERYRIVLGIGSAIEYLHTGDQNPILHRDIKPSNVMLDDDFEAKLGDFGLVRQIHPGHGSSLEGTVMIGTRAYMDPVCMSTNTASTASDIYSFGVLLLEIATGLMPTEVAGSGGLLSNTLISTVRESYGRGSVLEMADRRLNGDFDEGEMERVLLVGLLCVQQDRRHRPEIRIAVNMLSNLKLPSPRIRS